LDEWEVKRAYNSYDSHWYAVNSVLFSVCRRRKNLTYHPERKCGSFLNYIFNEANFKFSFQSCSNDFVNDDINNVLMVIFNVLKCFIDNRSLSDRICLLPLLLGLGCCYICFILILNACRLICCDKILVLWVAVLH